SYSHSFPSLRSSYLKLCCVSFRRLFRFYTFAISFPLGVDIALNELDNSHRSVVTRTEASLHNTKVTAITRSITRCDRVKQLSNRSEERRVGKVWGRG